MATEFVKMFNDSLGEMQAIAQKKNADYASGVHGEDPFRNFLLCEKMGLCSAEQGILVRMTDKLQRIVNLLKPGASPQVADESVDDTLLDLANYAVILRVKRQMTLPSVQLPMAPCKHPLDYE